MGTTLRATLLLAALLVAGASIAPLATVVRPLTADASSSYDGSHGPGNLIQDWESVPSTPADPSLWLFDPNVGALTMWHSDLVPVADVWLKFGLGAVYDLRQVHIWQMSQAGWSGGTYYDLTGRGVKDMTVYVGPSTSGPWTLAATMQLAKAVGSDPPPSVGTQSFALNNADGVSWVMFDIGTAWSGATNEYVGLAEVRFDTTPIPEPTTAAMLGLASLALCRRGRQRRDSGWQCATKDKGK